MRSRDKIEKFSKHIEIRSPYYDGDGIVRFNKIGSTTINLKFQQLILEVLLDIRDLLGGKDGEV